MKKPIYDKHYKENNYFGEAYPKLIKYLKKYEPKGKVLDLGCGQGRDAVSLAKMGFEIHGVDISSVGINQLLAHAKKEQLNITTEVADIYSYKIDQSIDIVFMDSMLHFYKQDFEKESGLVKRLLHELKSGGVLCNLIINSKKTVSTLKKVIDESGIKYEILHEEIVEYPEFQSTYHMCLIKKVS
ncbi:MAG: class I SAM-dependent methyltransferase [Psychrilyobacter sp.]|uniref:class I SAM-dependent methyltransferase n=1 Tax=Psychrilyobacter sp. TaxID=2586924 RepID=UPI003C761B94